MNYKFVFFGSSDFSVLVLEELKTHGVLPALVVTMPDKPQGRKLKVQPNVVKVWAEENDIEVNTAVNSSILASGGYEFFLVASYGKILPKEIFDIPLHKTLNIHPSLLPKYRGASPIISQILDGAVGPEPVEGKEMGTSIMQIAERMDAGPVLGQRVISTSKNYLQKLLHPGQGSDTISSDSFSPLNAVELERVMAHESVDLLLTLLPDYLSGKLEPSPQDESVATYCRKIEKKDGLLDMNDDPRKNLLKIKAFAKWPRAYYFHNDKRVIVTDAELSDSGELEILKVIPEGKKEMSYEDFLRGQR